MYNCAFDSLRGYSYKLPNSIINCPDLMEGGILMPLATSLQFFNGNKTKTIYQGKREISAIDRRGNFIGIGERASPGQLISAVLLDTRDIQRPKVFNYQKTQITHMAIAPSGEYFCTVGSTNELEDELIIIQTGNQSQVGTKVFFNKPFKRKDGRIMSIKFSNLDSNFFVLLCVNKVLFFRIDTETGAVQESMARTSRVREYNNFIFSPDDQFLYCCSKNGDISEVSIQEGKQVRVGPRRRIITKGISNLKYLHPGFLVICGMEGLLAIIELKQMRLLKEVKLQDDQITSMSEFSHGQAFIATNHAVIYRLFAETLDTELFYTCCSTKINSIAFLKGYSEIFGTCSGGEIIVWKTKTLTPALRIALPKVQCLSLHFPKNGKYIVSGWSDDSVRVFSPKSGKLIHRISECNLAKVCEITSDQDSIMAICGGQNGVIRMWNLMQSKIFGLILGSLAFHMQRVNCLRISPFNPDQLVSCCDDGSYAVWSLSLFQLKHSFHMMNFIKDIHFVDQLTIRLAGSGNIIYECFLCDGIIKREMEVAGTCINSMVECLIQATGERLLIYGGDSPQLSYFQLQAKNVQLIRLQSYGEITKLMVAPNHKSVLAVTSNGIIISYFIFPIKQMKDDLGWLM